LIPVETYPENIVAPQDDPIHTQVFSPHQLHVVMGANGKAECEVHLDQLQQLGIPLYKRKGGGGTVLLGPHSIVVTLAARVHHPYRSLEYFHAINRALIRVFRTWRDLDYQQRGISDITVGDRKLVGSSIFRRRLLLWFQGSILLSDATVLVSRCLRHPAREPDYRCGRSHDRFMSSLRAQGIDLPTSALINDLQQNLGDLAQAELRNADLQIAAKT